MEVADGDVGEERDAKRRRIDIDRDICQHGIKCYRRNPIHLLEYSHPHLEELYEKWTKDKDTKLSDEFPDKCLLLDQLKILMSNNFNPSKYTSSKCRPNSSSSTKPQKCKMSMKEKWDLSMPFNFFLTRNHSNHHDKYDPLSVNFKELFESSMGEIKALLHINFMIEADWLIDQYSDANIIGKETTLIYGVKTEELNNMASMFSQWVQIKYAKSSFPYGHHHSKLSVVLYDDESIRLMVYTANLIQSDWDNRTQGVWISPRCSKLSESSSPDVIAKRFKADFLQYLSSYPNSYVSQWVDRIRAVDFSPVKVIFIASAPNPAKSLSNGFSWGLKKLEKSLALNKICQTDQDWPLVLQCSSIGTLGADDAWLRGELGAAMTGPKKDSIARSPIHLIYPSHKNVMESYDGVGGGGCLPYSNSTNIKQPWLKDHMYQWKSDSRYRTKAIPHIKSYFRLSPDKTEIAWFLLTSANLSKAAWGKLNKDSTKLQPWSWECGILFIPNILISKDTFKIRNKDNSNDIETFPLPYDVPLMKYNGNDKPWLMDTLIISRSMSMKSSTTSSSSSSNF